MRYNKSIKVTVLLTLFLQLNSVNLIYSQDDTKILQFSTSFTGDFTGSLIPGITRRPLYLGMESLNLKINTESAKLWKGGILKIRAINTHGARPSADYIGDLQVYDNIEAGDHTGFMELSYEQKLGNFYLLAGQHDLNSDFASNVYCDLFFNSSFGIPPSLSLNIPVSIYPVTTPCIYARYETDVRWLYRLAVYEGHPGSFKSNRYGLNFNISPDDGYLAIAETEYSNLTGFNMAGVFKFGAYYHSGTFHSSADSTVTIKGNYGFYFLLAKRLLPSFFTSGEGLNGFIQAGYAPPDRNMVGYYISGGLRMKGFLKHQANDNIGIAVAYASLPNEYIATHSEAGKAETSMELTYKIYINHNFILQPDLQYILNSGAKKEAKNAFVATLRFHIEFE